MNSTWKYPCDIAVINLGVPDHFITGATMIKSLRGYMAAHWHWTKRKLPSLCTETNSTQWGKLAPFVIFAAKYSNCTMEIMFDQIQLLFNERNYIHPKLLLSDLFFFLEPTTHPQHVYIYIYIYMYVYAYSDTYTLFSLVCKLRRISSISLEMPVTCLYYDTLIPPCYPITATITLQ